MEGHVRDELRAKQRNAKALYKEDWQHRADFASGQKLPSQSDCGIRFFFLCLFAFFLLNRGRFGENQKEK
jgi:hypothetical protein